MSAATTFRSKKQHLIDAGIIVGLSSQESAELWATRTRIAELEAEFATVKRALELFGEGRVVRPKELFLIVERLDVEGSRSQVGLHGAACCFVGFFHVA